MQLSLGIDGLKPTLRRIKGIGRGRPRKLRTCPLCGEGRSTGDFGHSKACGTCRAQRRQHPSVRAPRVPRSAAQCSVDGCTSKIGKHGRRGYCAAHLRRFLKFGDPQAQLLPRAARPLGPGRWIDAEGYVQIHLRNAKRKISEHRLVMERALCRKLQPGESVHHRNGIRSDNRFTNLELWTSTQPSGQRASELVAWAKKILETYEPEALACARQRSA